jgi:hypothetical protein
LQRYIRSFAMVLLCSTALVGCATLDFAPPHPLGKDGKALDSGLDGDNLADIETYAHNLRDQYQATARKLLNEQQYFDVPIIGAAIAAAGSLLAKSPANVPLAIGLGATSLKVTETYYSQSSRASNLNDGLNAIVCIEERIHHLQSIKDYIDTHTEQPNNATGTTTSGTPSNSMTLNSTIPNSLKSNRAPAKSFSASIFNSYYHAKLGIMQKSDGSGPTALSTVNARLDQFRSMARGSANRAVTNRSMEKIGALSAELQNILAKVEVNSEDAIGQLVLGLHQIESRVAAKWASSQKAQDYKSVLDQLKS